MVASAGDVGLKPTSTEFKPKKKEDNELPTKGKPSKFFKIEVDD